MGGQSSGFIRGLKSFARCGSWLRFSGKKEFGFACDAREFRAELFIAIDSRLPRYLMVTVGVREVFEPCDSFSPWSVPDLHATLRRSKTRFDSWRGH